VLQDRVRTSISRGETVEQDSARGVPDAYRSWNYPGFYLANLEFLHRIATAR
jgi:hypothetical protein